MGYAYEINVLLGDWFDAYFFRSLLGVPLQK